MPQTEYSNLPLADADVLEAFYRAQTNTRTRFLQVSTGPADLFVRQLELGQVRVLEANGDGRHLWHDEMLSDEWRIALLQEASGAARIGGIDASPTLVTVIRPGESLGFATLGHYRTLEINIEEELVKENGWETCLGLSADVPESLVTALIATAQAAFAAFDRTTISAPIPDHSQHWAAIVIDQVHRIFEWWARLTPVPTGSRGVDAQADIVRRASLRLRDIDYAKSARVDDLCRDIGTSRRSLFLAFQRQLGIGPRRFNELIRLHHLRGCLYRAESDATTVSGEAEKLGFPEMGRLARTYRQVFGEAPSVTLRTRN